MISRLSAIFLESYAARRIYNVRLSTLPITKETKDFKFETNLNDLEGLSTIFPKKRAKLPQKPPFVKNLFLGKFDTDILTYPQLQKEDVDELERVLNILQKNSIQNNEVTNMKEIIQKLKHQRCLGLQCPVDVGGRELNQSEHCRYNEILLDNKFKFNLLSNELAIIALWKFGTDQQKDKYLEKLLDGSNLATLTMGESAVGSKNAESKTIADVSEDLKTYLLNGKKMGVINVSESNYYIVFAQMGNSVKGSLHELDLTAFLIDCTLPGITIENIETMDPNLKGMCNIIFNNTPVSSENILGIERDGRRVLSTILPDYHLNFSVMSLNVSKKLAKHLSEAVLHKSTPGEEIYKTEAITSKLGEILTHAYMIESMIYLTSGIMSAYENQDCEIESLITKVLSVELALKSVEIGFSLTGVSSIESTHFCQELYKDVLSQFTVYENHNSLRILIALLGIQHSGKHIGETVKKLRNPLFHGSFILKRLWQDRNHYSDQPKLTLGLKNYLHMSCQGAANQLEYCILRLQFVTETLLARNGIDILNKHAHLSRVAEIVMQIYTMIACLSRASRSYCIGLQYSDHEILMANVICKNCTEIVKKNVNHILLEHDLNEMNNNTLTENLFNTKEYYFAHPLTRNF